MGFGINEKNVQNTGVDCAYTKENISFRNGLLVFTQREKALLLLVKHGPLKKHLITLPEAFTRMANLR